MGGSILAQGSQSGALSQAGQGRAGQGRAGRGRAGQGRAGRGGASETIPWHSHGQG